MDIAKRIEEIAEKAGITVRQLESDIIAYRIAENKKMDDWIAVKEKEQQKIAVKLRELEMRNMELRLNNEYYDLIERQDEIREELTKRKEFEDGQQVHNESTTNDDSNVVHVCE